METLASYSFLPWARQGIGSRINEKDTLGISDGSAIERPVLKASVEVKYKSIDKSIQSSIINKDISVIGPGDVLNVSIRNIVRTEPQSGVTNFEANGLAYLEFYDEDFPWRFTPASAENSDVSKSRLRPWLTLLALTTDEFTIHQDPDRLPYISIKQEIFNNAFPHEKDGWAFAHVHFNHHLASLQGQGLQQEVSQQVVSNPDVALSRLLCSRKLRKDTGYTAFLIPAFETGRLSGLGLAISGVKAQAPSWKKGAMPASSQRPFDFPVYFQWNFRTAAAGDFEALAAKLKPAVLSADSGKIPMDISNPGFNLAAANLGTRTIGMEAALKPPSLQKDNWPTNPGGSTNNDDQETVNKLKNLLNLSADLIDKNAVVNSSNPFFNTNIGDDPLLVPPVYGVWHAQIQKLGDTNNPAWIETLNLDFRNRAAAGLGKKLVQQRQEDFMNRAWQQVNKINEANKQIQQASLTSMVNTAILKKHFVNGGIDKTLLLTHPVQHLVKNPAQKQTVQKDFIDSRIPVAAKSAAFRRITRPFSRTPMTGFFSSPSTSFAAKALFNSTPGAPPNILQRFNADPGTPGVLAAAKLKAAPDSALQMNVVQQSMDSALSLYAANVPNMAKDQFIKLVQTNINTGPLSKTQLLQLANSMSIPNTLVKTELIDWINNIVFFPVKKTNNLVLIQLTDSKFNKLFGATMHITKYNDIIIKDSTEIENDDVRAIPSLSILDDLKGMQNAFNLFKAKTANLPVANVLPSFNQLENVSKYLISKINPAVTLTKKLAATIKVFQNGQYVPLQNLKPVMAYPEFTEAVYSYLLDMSKNYILPNMDKLLENSVTVLENNQTFIESFMAGLNHEMARELLWREFPTDQRGSYFRQFWSVKDNLFPQSTDPEQDKELKLDIKKIHEWTARLGENSPRSKTGNLVLVIRGELLKKFPNAMIYAQQAAYDVTNPSGPRKLKQGLNPGITKFPLFKADIDPDITLVGFDLEATEARGEKIFNNNTPTIGKNPGWFFVLKERPGQLRFGMDDFGAEHGDDSMPATIPANWNDLAWEHLVGNKNDLLNYHINFAKPISITNSAGQPVWGNNSADLASILFQNPVLVARHAAEMLEEE
jgi:hypothetical protein